MCTTYQHLLESNPISALSLIAMNGQRVQLLPRGPLIFFPFCALGLRVVRQAASLSSEQPPVTSSPQRHLSRLSPRSPDLALRILAPCPRWCSAHLCSRAFRLYPASTKTRTALLRHRLPSAALKKQTHRLFSLRALHNPVPKARPQSPLHLSLRQYLLPTLRRQSTPLRHPLLTTGGNLKRLQHPAQAHAMRTGRDARGAR